MAAIGVSKAAAEEDQIARPVPREAEQHWVYTTNRLRLRLPCLLIYTLRYAIIVLL